jgi:hypothetical protein
VVQQEIRVGGLAVAGLLHGERLIKKEAAGSHGPDESREERPVEVVDDDDQVVGLPAQVDLADLQVHHSGLQRKAAADGLVPQLIDGLRVSIDGDDGEASLSQEEGMPSPAAGYVEGVACAREKVFVEEEPGRRAGVSGHAPG